MIDLMYVAEERQQACNKRRTSQQVHQLAVASLEAFSFMNDLSIASEQIA